MRGDVSARGRHLRSQKNLTAALEPHKGRPVRAWASGEENPGGGEGQESCWRLWSGETGQGTRRAGAGAKLQGRPEPKTEAGLRKGTRGLATGIVAVGNTAAAVTTGDVACGEEGNRAGWATAKKYGVGDDYWSLRSQALKAETLEVPAGWNKPASRYRRRTCWEVEKTCERGAVGVESRRSRRPMMALWGQEPWEALGSFPGVGVRNALKSGRSL